MVRQREQRQLIVYAHAKVNLYLKVGGRRPDGYHDLQTIFHSINLADEIEVEQADDLEVTCSDPAIPAGPGNLVYRAAAALAEKFATPPRACIHIRKEIPAQAGLGGGSADAAAALVALNRLWNLGATDQQLEQIGAALGADVPFCVRGGAAYAEGIGERLQALPPLPPGWLVIVKPDAAISTRLAYEALDARPPAQDSDPSAAIRVVRDGALEWLPDILQNDFEAVALENPAIRRAHDALRELSRGVLLCGSGAAIFGLAEDHRHAVEIQGRLGLQGWQARIAQFASSGCSEER